MWGIFSRKMNSSSRGGLRSPAFSDFWLSLMRTPWLVVSFCSLPSSVLRARSALLALASLELGFLGLPVIIDTSFPVDVKLSRLKAVDFKGDWRGAVRTR